MGAKSNLRYHLVLVTKYRKPALAGVENDIISAFYQAAKKTSMKIEKIAVENGDHVHLVVRTTGTYSLSSTVARIKMLTTKSLWGSHSTHLRRLYWSKRKKLWSGGYYAATVGDVSIDYVKKYLEKQGHWK